MILEMDEYVSMSGESWGMIGGALSAVGSVLAGIGRSQNVTPDQQQILLQQQKMQEELEREKAKSRRTTWIVIGVSLIVVIGLVLAFKASKKAVEAAELNPKLATV
jgi:hypothetical protein